MKSPYTVNTNQVLRSEPTHLTPGDSRIEAAVCFAVITDWTLPSQKQYFSLALSLLGSGADVPSAFLHADHLHSPLTSAAWAAPAPALPWWWARRLLHLLPCRMIFFIQFCAAEKQFVTGTACSLGLYKPTGMYTRKMYIIKHPEQSWPLQASSQHHKYLNENCVKWEKNTGMFLISSGKVPAEQLFFFYQTRLAGSELCREIGHGILS